MRIHECFPLETSKRKAPIYDTQFKKYVNQVNRQLMQEGMIMIPFNKDTYLELLEILKQKNPDENISYKIKGNYIIIDIGRIL